MADVLPEARANTAKGDGRAFARLLLMMTFRDEFGGD